MELELVTHLLLEAAVDPARWSEAMSSVAQYGRATGAVLLPIHGRIPFVPYSPSLHDAYQTYFKEGWHLRDERDQGIPTMRRSGIFTDQDFATEKQLKTSDYYNAFLTPHEINWSAGLGVRTDSEEWCLVFERGSRQGAFEKEEQDRLKQLMPAMRQAAFLGQKLSHARALGVSDAFDLIGSPCILIDRLGKVFRANKSAESYFEDGFFLAGSELSCTHASDTSSLRRIVLSLCSETNHVRLAVPRSLVVRRNNRRPFMVQAVQLSGMICEVFSPARVLLFIIDPFADKASVPADELRRLFGLTKAETDLLLILERDVPLTAAAEQLHIKYETARTHLKSIMQKTQTKRQAELLSMVQRMTVRIST